MPDFCREQRLIDQGFARIAGVDEVGRGPFAGPVMAAAVILDPGAIPVGLADSKKLSAARRSELEARLIQSAEIGIGSASVIEIDRLNILQASLLAMQRAVAALTPPVDYLLIDGNKLPADLPCPATALVGGDNLCASIAAASIVAKIRRDRLMVGLSQQHPQYGWDRNAGYGTREHQVALKNHGVTPHHRRSFRPIHNILYQEK